MAPAHAGAIPFDAMLSREALLLFSILAAVAFQQHSSFFTTSQQRSQFFTLVL
jgi:hypothetical protein